MSSLRKWHQWAVAFLAAASVLFGVGGAQAQAQAQAQAETQPLGIGEDFDASAAPEPEDFVLLQLQIKKYRMRNDLRGYRTRGGVCVDMADMIQTLELAVRIDKKSRRATGWLFSEDRSLTIDRDSNTVQIMNETRKLQPGELIDTREGWCVDTRSLAGWMGVTLTPNLYESVLVLESDDTLPFMQALERKSRAARLRPDRDRRDLSAYPHEPQPYKMWRLPSVDVLARGAYRENRGRGSFKQVYEIFASGEAARVSYNMRLASNSNGTPDTLRVRGFRKDPEGELLGPLKATQVAAGDVEILSGNLAGAGGVGRGAFVSNRALQRPTRFGTTVLRGALPLGWDAELYRNGQLLGFQNATVDGRYEFEVNLVYGHNDMEVVLYGPQGQVRRERQSIPVGFGAVPPGKVEYWAGIVQRNRDLINFGGTPPSSRLLESGWQYGAGVQYGLDQRTVVGANGHSVFLEGSRREYAELSVQRALGPMLVNLAAAQELGRGMAYRTDILGRIGKINVQFESFFVDGGYTSGLVGEDERSAHRLQIDTMFKLGPVPVPISGGLRRSTQRDGRKVNELLARGSLIMPRLALTGFMLHRNTEGGRGREDGTRLGLLANTHIAGIGVRGEGTYRLNGPERGFDSASVTLERGIDEQSELQLDIEHSARFKQTDFGLAYVRQFRHFAVRGGAQMGTNGLFGANVAISFSLGRDPLSGGVRFSREKLARRGHAAVSVFLDKNGDGHRSADELPLEGVGITAGQRWADAPTDENGHAFVEGLSPYQEVLISVDESTLPDPFLMPVGKGKVITPRPGIPAVIEIAVAPTGEVEGVVNGPEGTPLAGVELELIDSDGQIVARTMSEYDGFFLFDRVAYGTYSLRLSEQSAEALGMAREIRSGIELNDGHTLDRVGIVQVNLPTYIAGSSRVAVTPELAAADQILPSDSPAPVVAPPISSDPDQKDPDQKDRTLDEADVHSDAVRSGAEQVVLAIPARQAREAAPVAVASAEAGPPPRASPVPRTSPVPGPSPIPGFSSVPGEANAGDEAGIDDQASAIFSGGGFATQTGAGATSASASVSGPDATVAEPASAWDFLWELPLGLPYMLPASGLVLAFLFLLWKRRRRMRRLLSQDGHRDE